jgi:hypothetical protein
MTSHKAVVVLAASALLFGAAVLAHEGHHEEDKPMPAAVKVQIVADINQHYMQDVKPILMAKCADCHSDRTVYPWYYKVPLVKQLIDHDVKTARRHLDISNDFPFIGHEGKSSMADNFDAIHDVIDDDDMPPWEYTLMHSKAKLTGDDKKVILGWVSKSDGMLDNAAAISAEPQEFHRTRKVPTAPTDHSSQN